MDDVTFEGLREALRATPDNTQLRSMLIRACLTRGDDATGQALLEEVSPSNLTVDARRAGAQMLLNRGAADRALALLPDEDAESKILQARALLALGRHDEGQRAYLAAVNENATLENAELSNALRNPHEATSGSPDGRLRIVTPTHSHDETVDRLLGPALERITFEDVGGLHDVKKAIRRRIIMPFEKPSLFERFRRKVGGGVLLYGPPGCGKTMIARATAGEANATFINVAISDILDMYIGESERKLHAVFERARASAPCVLFFDELEALAANRKYARESNSGKMISLFLSEMDGFAKNNAGVLLIGATNVPWSIDPAFQRPGRFDRVMFVPPPDLEARKVILDKAVQNRPTEDGLHIAALARQTSGFSGADLSNLIESAVDEAIDESLSRGEEVSLGQRHLDAAKSEVRATTAEWLTTARNHARYSNEGGRYDDVLAFLEAHGRKR